MRGTARPEASHRSGSPHPRSVLTVQLTFQRVFGHPSPHSRRNAPLNGPADPESGYFYQNSQAICMAFCGPAIVRSRCHDTGVSTTNTQQHPYVLNLPDWELPHLDDLEWTLVESLAARVRLQGAGSESLEDALHEQLHEQLLKVVERAVNETIEYWLKGLGDGNDGDWPELSIELPYLEHGDAAEPLTLVYRVENADGTRTELNRTTLGAVLSRILEEPSPAIRRTERARAMAAELRQLAQRLEDL